MNWLNWKILLLPDAIVDDYDDDDGDDDVYEDDVDNDDDVDVVDDVGDHILWWPLICRIYFKILLVWIRFLTLFDLMCQTRSDLLQLLLSFFLMPVF